jgi:hypothetical protein
LCHGFGGQKLLQPEQVINIAAFLMDLLAQTKHRGAFEQAYVAFTKVCMAIQYPTVWISRVLGFVFKIFMNTKFTFRRSASVRTPISSV